MQYVLLIPFLKFFLFLTKKLNLGSGSTWPGHIALKFDNKFVARMFDKSNSQVILVVGTNGKTTTSSMIEFLLKEQKMRVFRNREGANLLNGIASSILKHCSFSGKLEYDFAVFEVDENNLPVILKHLKPSAVLVLNLFRDQLDRYGEVNTIAEKWHKSLESLNGKTKLILNSDDPLVGFLGENTKHKALYFDIPEEFYKKKRLSFDVDSIFCPVSGDRLEFMKISYSHLGKFNCSVCGYKNKNAEEISVKKYPLDGAYNIYNANAALLTVAEQTKISISELSKHLENFKPTFGRGEIIKFWERKFVLLLSKNPAGFNQSIQRVIDDLENSSVILALNDRIPDGRDISWIWDVEFEKLCTSKCDIYLTGDRVGDLSIRMMYAENLSQDSNVKSQNHNSELKSFEKYIDAIEYAVNHTKKGERIYVLPTYSAMLEIRKKLTGRRIL